MSKQNTPALKIDPTDLVGRRYGRLVVESYLGSDRSPAGALIHRYKCKCDCGNYKVVPRGSLISHEANSCGCLKTINPEDIIGQRYGKLTVMSYEGRKIQASRPIHIYRCKCDCGNEIEVNRSSLLNGRMNSCGCLKRGPRFTHQQSKTRLYGLWQTMKRKRAWGYRGESLLCREWSDFENFWSWAEKSGYKEGQKLYLWRKDPEGFFSPENCFWSKEIQRR